MYKYKRYKCNKQLNNMDSTHDSRYSHKSQRACIQCEGADCKEQILLGSRQMADLTSVSQQDMYCCYHAESVI